MRLITISGKRDAVIDEVLRRAARRLSPALAVVLSVALCTACSSSGHAPTSQATDPTTEAQINARLLGPRMAPGFNEARAPDTASRSAHAQSFVPPSGDLDNVCNTLATPELFRPGGILDTGEDIVVANPKQYSPLPPAWFEYIDVYPGTEAAGIVTELTSLIGRCGHFQFKFTGILKPLPATEEATQIRGLGSRALYVTVRVGVQPGLFQVLDWVLIRAGRTLIWIVDQSGSSRADTGRDALTLRLAQDAWRHYRTA
jgi:hypothetical protein